MFDLNLTCPIFIALFLAFIQVFKALVLKPLNETMAKRLELTQGNLAKSDALRAQSLDLERVYDDTIIKAKHEAKQIIADSMARVHKANQQLIVEAQNQSKATLENTKNLLYSDVDRIVSSLMPELTVLAKEVARKAAVQNLEYSFNVDSSIASKLKQRISA